MRGNNINKRNNEGIRVMPKTLQKIIDILVQSSPVTLLYIKMLLQTNTHPQIKFTVSKANQKLCF